MPWIFRSGGGQRDTGSRGNADGRRANPQPNRPLPGVAAIALWMFMLCLMGLLGVSMHKLPGVVLVLCVAFGAGGQGLLMQRRWGWALSLATVFLSAIYGMWTVYEFHRWPMAGMAFVNMILFLYLIRPEVRERLR